MSDRDIQQQTNNQMLGRYKILQRLGRGGMGDVWLCEDPRLHRQVAIKTLPAHNQQDEEFVARFEHEAQAAAALNHPHILPIHDYGTQTLPNGSLITYIVMPYIRGGSLADLIASYAQKQALMLIPEALAFLSQAAEAIDHAHEQHVLHRDIKPGNMLLREDDWLLLADFGIARMLTEAGPLTATSPGLGTPEYMAPEQARGQAVTGSDNYSLAVIAYQLFTGRLPFQADTGYATTIQHMTMPPPSPREINPALSLAFEQVLLQGLAKQPAERPASAMAFVKALQAAHNIASSEPTYRKIVASQTASTVLTPDSDQSTITQETLLDDQPNQENAPALLTRRRLLLGGSSAAVLAIGGGLGAWKIMSTSTPPQRVPQPTTTIKNSNAPTFVLTGHNYPAQTLAWHPQTHTLVSASGQDYVMITWDIDILLAQPKKSPLYLKSTNINTKNSQPLTACSPDGKYLALANNATDNANYNISLDLYTFNAKTRIPTPLASIPIPTQNTIDAFGWIQNRYLVTVEHEYGSQNSRSLMRISDITQPHRQWAPVVCANQQLAQPKTETSVNASALAIAPDGVTIALALFDESILIGRAGLAKDEQTLKWQPLIAPLQLPVLSQALITVGTVWSADANKIIVVNADGSNSPGPLLWNWRESKPHPQNLTTPAESSSIAFSALTSNPASSTPCFATGNKNGTVSLWNAVAGSFPIRTLDNGGINAPVVAMAWSQDGHWLAASFADVNASILIWKV